MSKATAAVVGGAFLGTILAANYVTTRYGMVPVGFGLVATAGTYFAGLSFVLRDAVQDTVRKNLSHMAYAALDGTVGVEIPPAEWRVAVRVLSLIALGAALSFAIGAPGIAIASAVAFGFSETADWLIYQPLRDRGYVRAAMASNFVGALVDTVAFLAIAGFPLRQAFAGQMVGKLLVTAAVVGLVIAVRESRRPVTA